INAHKINESFREIGLLLQQSEDGAGLRHGFDDQNPGHDGDTGEMAVEKWLIDADVLQRNEPVRPVDLNDSVDQEKRVSMRNNPHDLGNSELVHYFLAGSAAFGAGGAAAAGAFVAAASMRRIISVVMSARSCT